MPTTTTAAGNAQKGPFQPGGTAVAFQLQADGMRSDASVSGDIGSDGGFSLTEIDWKGPTQLEMTGRFFNEVTGNFSMGNNGEATLRGLVALPDEQSANVNLFTHFIAARVQTLMADGTAFANARTQARGELATIMGIDAAPGTLDLLHDNGDAEHEDDSANLLLFSAATLAAGADQMDIDKLAADFADDGRINGAGQDAFDAVKQAAVDHPDLLATARSNLQNQYGVTPPDDTDGNAPAWVPGAPAAPVAAFATSGPLHTGETQSFDAQGATGDGLSYAWDFGDGDTATGAQTTHVYANADDYTVTLTVSDSANRTDTASKTLTITEANQPPAPPEATFKVSGDRTAGTALDFDASGSTGASLSYAWDFGDTNSATGAQPSHAYNDTGDYTVTLTVTDSAGQTDSATRTLTIAAAAPQAAFTTGGPATAGQPQRFDASNASGNGLSYYWDFGDGDAGRNGKIAHVYDDAGDYTVTLKITDGNGNTDSTSQSVTIAVGEQPAANDGSIQGTVVDTNGDALPGVQAQLVRDNSKTATTDADGKAALANLPTGVDIVLELTKAGYADRYVRTTIPADTTGAQFSATMILRQPAQTLANAENGGTLSGADGASIALPANALVDGNGEPVSGSVQVALTPVNVSDADERGAFPGSFAAANENGDSGVLLSYGVAEYQLTQNGGALQLAAGKQASLTIPIYIDTFPDGSQVNAGDNIPLWSLDETTGEWVQEGTGNVVASSASPTGLALEITAGHLSWYNADHFDNPYEVIPHCKVDSSSGLPTLDLSETCVINGSLVGSGPYSNLSTNISGNNSRPLPVPSNVGYQLRATARNATLVGSKTVNGNGGTTRGVDIVLRPAGNGGGGEAITLPYDEAQAIDPAGEVDRYQVTDQAGKLLHVAVDASSVGATLQGTLELLDPNGQSLGKKNFSGTATADIFAKLPADGNYTIEVDGTDNEPGGYHIVVDRVPEISLDENIEDTLARGSVAYRRFEGTAGTIIGVLDLDDATFTVTDLDQSTTIARSNFSSSDLGKLPADGTYLLQISGGSYRGAVTRIEAPQPLSLDSAGRATASGNIQAYGDRQFYKLTAAGGDGLLARLSQAASDALVGDSAKVRVYRLGNTPLDQASPVSAGDVDVYSHGDAPHLYSTGLRLPGNGTQETYLLEVSALFGADSAKVLGKYDLRVDTAPSQASIVVDDDLAQCAGADSHSVRASAYAVTDGGSIDVCNGVYSEYIPVTAPDGSFSVAGRSRSGVMLRSADSNQEIVNGEYSGNAAQVQLDNLSLQTGGLGPYNRGAYVGRIADITDVTIEAEPGETHLPGALSISTDNAVIDSLDYTTGDGKVTIEGDNVTVRNSHFTGSPGAIETKGKNLLFENNTLDISNALGGEFGFNEGSQFGSGGGGLRFLNNTITITSSDPDRLGDGFALIVGDDGSGDTAAIIRGNTLVTDNGGFSLEGTGTNAAFTMEQNRLTSTAAAGGKLLQAYVAKKSAQGSTTLRLRNNVFDGMAALGGSPSFDSAAGLTIINPVDFAAVDIINNSFRATVNDEFRDDNDGMVSVTTYDDDQPASYPVRLRNNIFQGIGDANKADTAIQITSGVAIDADYDLFFGFDTVYAGGSTSAGGNDITGQDPQYTDSDLNVDPTSPAVNAGAAPMADGPPIPAEDIDGVARPQGANYDIGAHEYEP